MMLMDNLRSDQFKQAALFSAVLALCEGVAPAHDGHDPCWSQGPADHNNGDPIVNKPRPGRNEPCPCGSGRKHKRCCGGRAPSDG